MATASKPLKTSYCTTCKGRLHHLQQTLPANMKAEEGNPNVEFVVLDYGSEDGLGEWIKANFQREMDSGRLIYARTEAEYFKMAHAKNMAHRLAMGDVLCNVDADNFIAKDFSVWLSEQFKKNPDTIAGVGFLTRACKDKHNLEGVSGRLAFSRDAFNRLDGYDEAYSGWGGDDTNIRMRAHESGFGFKAIPYKHLGRVISHSNDQRLENLQPDNIPSSRQAMTRSDLDKLRLVAARQFAKAGPNSNPTKYFGCGDVNINFSDETTSIGPLSAPQRKGASVEIPDSAEVGQPAEANPDARRRNDWAASAFGVASSTSTRLTR